MKATATACPGETIRPTLSAQRTGDRPCDGMAPDSYTVTSSWDFDPGCATTNHAPSAETATSTLSARAGSGIPMSSVPPEASVVTVCSTIPPHDEPACARYGVGGAG